MRNSIVSIVVWSFALSLPMLMISIPIERNDILSETYSHVVSSVKNVVGYLPLRSTRKQSTAVKEIESIISSIKCTPKELESLLCHFSESTLRDGIVMAASKGNIMVVKALLNFGVMDPNTIERAMVGAADGNNWKIFELLVPYATVDAFNKVQSREQDDLESLNQDNLARLPKSSEYSLALWDVLINAIQNGKVDVVNAVFKRDHDLFENDQVLEMLISYFADIVSFGELENDFSMKEWIIIHGILLADSVKQFRMVKFLLSLIDITAENNLLLRTASYYNHINLVKYTISNEKVLKTGLDDAIELSNSSEIREMLISAHILYLIDEMAGTNNLAPAG